MKNLLFTFNIFIFSFSYLLGQNVQESIINNSSYGKSELLIQGNNNLGNWNSYWTGIHDKTSRLIIRDKAFPNGLYIGTDQFQGASTASYQIGTKDNLPIYFRTNSLVRLIMKANGNIGIGTTTPSEKLHVNGDVRIHATSNGRDFYLRPGSGSLDMYNANLSLNRYSEMNISMVQGGGNVGIGTGSPKNKLSVNGTIWAKKVKVTLEDAADWVFEEDYELRSLEEVEAYITKYKHLPDMPSAEEFKQNDMDVAEMNNKLLQKIEELTLYLIGQNKEIEILKAELETKN